jgi:NAD(P)H-hydrate epimerase
MEFSLRKQVKPHMLLPAISKKQMAEVDRLMVEEYRTGVPLMMEQAGLNLARLALQLSGGKVFRVIAGKGNNGGGGIVAARRLAGWGFEVELYVPHGIGRLRPLPKEQLARAKIFGVAVLEGIPSDSKGGYLIDAYLGYGFEPVVDQETEAVFSYISSQMGVISLDIPSGLDADSGKSFSGIRPQATLTLAFVKGGLLISNKEHIGELFIADIGIPMQIYESELGIKWEAPYSPKSLDELSLTFSERPIWKVEVVEGEDGKYIGWKTEG